VTMIPGDGVGPELMHAVKEVLKAADVPIQFEEFWVSEVQDRCSEAQISELIQSVNKNKVAIKDSTFVNHNHILPCFDTSPRKQLDLFANVVRVKSLPGVKTRHGEIDIVVIREQTEGEYSALEHESAPGVVESLKIITRTKSERIAKFAFDYATKHGRNKVTAVHKANIMKLADGMFLDSCRQVSKLYPKIKFEAMIVDNTCMQLASHPSQFDVMVMPNLYGNIIDNLAAGLVGGAGVVPGESYSPDCVVFETGARHPFAQAVGRNIANPTAMLMCAFNMLSHMNLVAHAKLVQDSLLKVLRDGKIRTTDLRGYATTTEFTAAVIANLG
uniref:Isocitrate dehydrogenase [NAD] subunit, mitochondrial n=1 Tax=Ciona savignyi TaxID=51511 RepID=H2ZJX1_CIOSA